MKARLFSWTRLDLGVRTPPRPRGTALGASAGGRGGLDGSTRRPPLPRRHGNPPQTQEPGAGAGPGWTPEQGIASFSPVVAESQGLPRPLVPRRPGGKKHLRLPGAIFRPLRAFARGRAGRLSSSPAQTWAARGARSPPLSEPPSPEPRPAALPSRDPLTLGRRGPASRRASPGAAPRMSAALRSAETRSLGGVGLDSPPPRLII